MGLRLKFNLVLLFVFALGLAVSGYISRDLLHRKARDDVLHNAGVVMETALSMDVSDLARSFNRMRRSLEKAISLIDQK